MAALKHLLTARGAALPASLWNAYPRPQLVREGWQCLNGRWRFGTDEAMREEILVPFCPESRLSGIRRDFETETRFYYERRFTLRLPCENRRILLHFGAVDQLAEVFVNGSPAGSHEGGYLPFTLDITDLLTGGENTLRVVATDALDHRYPWGKQKKNRGGMWYTPVSGIWQTVWLESVPEQYIERLKITTWGTEVRVQAFGTEEGTLTLEETGERIPLRDGLAVFPVADPVFWSPEEPKLYWFTLESGEDKVRSYFALRDVSVREVAGKKRICLNGKPYFFHGLLDQGYWSDGIYTPAAPECYEDDILAVKELGFNTLRKHIKIEPERFYYDCDRLGMIVFQDMVNNGDYHFLRDSALPQVWQRRKDSRLNRDPETRTRFVRGMAGTVEHLGNHPCICYWTIFNEGWGQFEADKLYKALLHLDRSRITDATSGWFHQRKSDVDSLHIYFKPLKLGRENRAQVLSEFGGFVWKDPDHSADPDKTYGYKIFRTREELAAGLRKIYEEQVIPLARAGLCAAIYTQVSDVEDETNGLLTYDRKVRKVSPEELAGIAEALQEAVREEES
ncbi:MAG: glycoside hydrolase family 2 [Lachnospiraceae bacterium]|nr:glycoside hydrolase family 2 [Lachnospiraceae bacterium]